jgi:ribonucleoside-triphosphate reductase (thioredoxin)
MIFNRFAHASQDRKVRQFSLSSSFVEDFQGEQPQWGPVGYFTYKRTYARPTCDCDDPRSCGHPTEEFWQTCQRVVEGVYNVQKIHCRQLGLPWNEPKAQKSAQEMFTRMWEFKFSPPGRGLAQMGAPFMFKKGGACLNNCAFVSSEYIDEDFAGPFTFLMDMSMLGVGVGGDTRGAGKVKLQMPKMLPEPFVVPDDREGWVDLARVSINAFAGKGSFPQVIDFSEVRPKGSRIRGFGGTASGPGPLAKLVKSIVTTLMPKDVEVSFEESFDDTGKIVRLETVTRGEGEPYKITSGRITDIYNMVGACVVAGGVRRSAEIMFGHPDDAEFRGLKDDTELRPLDKRMSELAMSLSLTADDDTSARLQAEIGELQAQIDAHPLRSHRWASNNSIFGEVGMDYAEVGQAIAKNGEPGILWLKNAQDYGRMVDPANFKDRRAQGANPCSEQTLESFELCCLVETYPAKHKDYKDFERTLKFAYLYAKTVTLMPTHDDRTNAVMIRNRRIGCSMSGIRQAIEKFGRREFLNWCDRGYGYIGELDTIYSEWLGIGPSIKTTSVKPSGTVSLLCGATPGIHPPHAPFYIRNIRVNEHSPLVEAARVAGHIVEKDAYADGTFVISFPVKTDNCSKGKRDVSIWEQVALAADLQRYWADNQVSVTVTFKPEEAAEIPTVLEVFEDRLKSISFLPLGDDHGYVQAPYIETTEEEFDAMVARISPMNLSSSKQEAEDKFCDGEACQLEFVGKPASDIPN